MNEQESASPARPFYSVPAGVSRTFYDDGGPSMGEVSEALDYISASCDRDRWTTVLMALHDEFGDGARDVARSWSATGSNFNEQDFASVWRSLKPGGGVTVKTLLKFARDEGCDLAELSRKHRNGEAIPSLTPAERQARQEAAEAERRHREGAKEFAYWETSLRAHEEFKDFPDATPSHPYLAKKKLAGTGLKINPANGALCIPYETPDLPFSGFQSIFPDGNRRFYKGAKAAGAFLRLDGADDVAFVTEGWADAASIHQATGKVVFCAFSASQLTAVARHAKSLHSTAKIVIAGDNDAPGLQAADKAAKAVFGEVAIPPQSGADWSDVWIQSGADALRDALAPYCAEDVQPETGSLFIRVGDLEYSEPDFIVDGFLESASLGMIFGDPACGKSFLALDLSACVAAGRPFHGRDVKQGSVFYIAGEGHNGLAGRMTAWSKANSQPLDKLPMFVSRRSAYFLDAAHAFQVTQDVQRLAEAFGSPRLIVIDTLARNFGDGDENSTQDMNKFIAAMDDLRAAFPASSVLIVHHTGHAEKKRARGAMALKGALDAEYSVEKDGDAVTVKNTKMKEGPDGWSMFFKLDGITLGRDSKGRDIGSAVLTASENGAARAAVRVTNSQRLALKAFAMAFERFGVTYEGDFSGIHVDHWRECFNEISTADKDNSKTVAFSRARKGLAEERAWLTVKNDIYRIGKDFPGSLEDYG